MVGEKWQQSYTPTKINGVWKSVNTMIKPLTEERWYKFKDIQKKQHVLKNLPESEKIKGKDLTPLADKSFLSKIKIKNTDYISFSVYKKICNN